MVGGYKIRNYNNCGPPGNSSWWEEIGGGSSWGWGHRLGGEGGFSGFAVAQEPAFTTYTWT